MQQEQQSMPRGTEEMRAPCSECNRTNGYIIIKNDQQCMYCAGCDRFQYNKPKERPKREGHDLVATLHRVQKDGRAFYAGKDDGACDECGSVTRRDFYLFKNDNGSLSLHRRQK